jgi:amino acid transporter
MSEVSMQKSSSGVFARKSSGLVRTVSTFDTFYFSLNQMNPAIGILTAAALVAYPGASLEWATILVLIGAIFLGISYALFSSVYPRSGAEYVPLSRVFHPLIGFVGSFSNTIWQGFYFGVAPAYAAAFAWAPMFLILGLQLDKPGLIDLGLWFDSPVGWFTVGSVIVLAGAFVLYRGAGTFFKVQRYIFSLALFGFVVLLVVLGLGAAGVMNFEAAFDGYAGAGAYQALIDTAAGYEIPLTPDMNMAETLNFMIWPGFAVLLAVWSTSFSGEVKNVTRGQLIAIPTAQTVGTLIMLGIGFFARMALGDAGLRAFGIAALLDPDILPIPIYPWVSTLAALMTGSPLVSVIILGGILLLFLVNTPAVAMYSTRSMLAWSIDGLAPKWLGKVSEKYHTPSSAIIVITVVAIAFLALYSFTSFFSVLSAQISFSVVLGLTAFAAAIFPYVKRDVYESSSAKIEFLGIPLMTISGLIAAVTMGFVGYRTAIDPINGANTPQSIGTIVGTFVVGALWYFYFVNKNKKEGVDMDARFDEIPVE